MKTFLLQYQYEGRWFCFEIEAETWGQAEALANMSPSIKLDGEKVAEYPLDDNEEADFIIITRED